MMKLAMTMTAALGLLMTGNAAEGPRLEGLMIINKNAVARIVQRDGSARWFAVGDKVGEFSLSEIDNEQERVVLKNSAGESQVIVLAQSKVAHAEVEKLTTNKTVVKPEDLNWAWIRSDANPMRKAPEALPLWVVLAWPDLGEDIQTDFKNFYRNHGWDLSRVQVTPDGRARLSISPLRNPSDPVLSKEELRKRSVPAGPTTPIKNK